MRFTLPLLILLILPACQQQHNDKQSLQARIDSLSNQFAHSYRPGLGEFMLGLQMHHAKLWFAGKEQNWKLAQFEADELKETLDDIKEFCNDREEVKSLPIIWPAADSVENAIQKKDMKLFNNSFTLLTNTCNTCHHATKHEFNVIKIPETPPVFNQDFKPQ